MEPMIEIAGARVFLGDCVEVMRSLPDNSVDSIVTDPPYGLEFMGKDWDAPWKKSGSFNGNIEETAESAGGVSKFANHRVRYQKGLEPMLGFQLWATEWATECLRVLKPGGHILAFGGSRTWHRLAVAVEDAGFELRDSIAWIYGSGFPKSLDVSKAIDKKLGAEREVVGQQSRQIGKGNWQVDDGGWQDSSKADENGIRTFDLTAPSTPEAQKWQGWGTALKPAFEPVVVGRKPFGKGVTVAENVLVWGVGGLNIDGSRIGSENRVSPPGGIPNGANNYVNTDKQRNADYPSKTVQGRWPANVILDEVSAGLLDEQSGVSTSKKAERGAGKQETGVYGEWGTLDDTTRGHNDTGGASRFFYVAKASKRDRNEGLEELPDTHPSAVTGRKVGSAGAQNGGYAGMTETPRKNIHPTVKPTQLMRYLIKLVTPEGGVVLDPFTGSGSTGKAALLDGYQFIGAELTEEYLPIIEGRLRWASEQKGDEDDTLF